MSRILYGPGARAGVVAAIQKELYAARFDPQGYDGVYGERTVAAVQEFQHAHGIPATGLIDDVTWQAMMKRPVPGVDVRSLELTAAFEGHGYTLAQGNWDGAWLTWGIIGFTLKDGNVQKIIRETASNSPDALHRAFGPDADGLIAIMAGSSRDQELWANSITVGEGRLAEPWRSGFTLLGQLPEVQQHQQQLAHDAYFVPAVHTARSFGLKSELGLALCFDLHVQNGGISPDARAAVTNAGTASHTSGERGLRETIANAVADLASARFADDVRARKLAIARGSGMVHGARFVLENWGLSEVPAPELA